METEWIEAVMRVNKRIVVTEARLSIQATRLVEMIMGGHDTTEAEDSFTSTRKGLIMLRMIRDDLLSRVEVEG